MNIVEPTSEVWYLPVLRNINVATIVLLTLSSIGFVWYLAWRLVLSELSFVQELLGMPRAPQEVTQSGSTTRRRYGHNSTTIRQRSTPEPASTTPSAS
mmetsp:Transcript_20089/g.43977  ORF Transcript_20089/g.43977 Transcript_20089/m.43977 type:complete len:98 (-) Transcript_20089:560-853(-)